MEFTQAPRTAEMQAAHDDVDVNTAVHHYMAAPSAEMTALLFECLFSEYHPGPGAVQLMIERKPVSAEAEEDARLMADAALRVAAGHNGLEPGRCRGAVLEEIAERLCRNRSGNVLVEQFVSPLAGYWNNRSRPIDVIVDEPQLEILECKMAWADFEEDDVRLFERIAALASADGRTCMPALVSPVKSKTLKRHVGSMAPACDFYVVSREDLHQLGTQPPAAKAA